MKTKIVYVVISNDNDIYLEQAWASAYSARIYNPDAHIAFITDEETRNEIINTARNGIMSIINEIIAVPFSKEINNMKRSRWIKTNLRDLIKGDILFIDTDTIITSSLNEIDEWDIDLGAVLDIHCPFKVFPYANSVLNILKKIYGIRQLKENTEYFNSGVLYIKDNQRTHLFFAQWHKNWEYSLSKGVATDQQSLIKTVDDMPNFITPISGNYNCQILGSIQYLHTAKIVHFFNAKWNDNTLCPFFGKDIYMSIKKNRSIKTDVEYQILHCKELFISPSIPICSNDVIIWNSPTFNLLRWINLHNKFLYRSIQFFSKACLWILKNIIRTTK